MREFEIFIGLVFLAASGLLLIVGLTVPIASAIHQIFQMMYFICSILCFGFGSLMIKSNGKNNE